eukprot:3128788-Pyramimonas_sp.AAC.1
MAVGPQFGDNHGRQSVRSIPDAPQRIQPGKACLVAMCLQLLLSLLFCGRPRGFLLGLPLRDPLVVRIAS